VSQFEATLQQNFFGFFRFCRVRGLTPFAIRRSSADEVDGEALSVCDGVDREPNAGCGSDDPRLRRSLCAARTTALCSYCLPHLHWWNVWGLAMGVKAAYPHEKRRISKYFAAVKHRTLRGSVQNILRLSAFRLALISVRFSGVPPPGVSWEIALMAP
jgi:hypothetical protein